jgi:hypothetical protein
VSQGTAVAVSADGNTAIVGGIHDSGGLGAAWVYTRSGGVWTQQGSKLVGTGAAFLANQGRAVAISADGNTAIVGGDNDDSGIGAAWVFTRSGGVWSQQGSKLVGTGAAGDLVQQGFAVAISADGNTAIVGGEGDNFGVGAAWVYTRSGGVWTQQGGKLGGTDAVNWPNQGSSVGISADGNTAVVGGFRDNSDLGAAWVYTRSGAIWSQQGSKLVGAGAIGNAFQGFSAAISADGDTVIVGGVGDNSDAGAAWVYTRSGGVWSQKGGKLVGTGAVGQAQQGTSASISADGNIAIVGGALDNSQAGAAWVFVSCVAVPCLQSAVSRKLHGAAGALDLPLSLIAANPATEPRQGPAHTIVFTFDSAVTAATATVTEGIATVGAPAFSGNDVVVGLTGVADQQYVTIDLTGVTTASSTTGAGSVRVGFLAGDVNQTRVVSVADLGFVNAQLAQPVTMANFLKDVNASGAISVADKGITNANLTRALPPP